MGNRRGEKKTLVQKGINDFETLCLLNGREYLLDEWDYEENTLKPDEVTYFSTKLIHWKCKKGHTWVRMVLQRTDKRNLKYCPYCAGRIPIEGETDFKTLYPGVASEWDYERNEKSPEQYLPGSGYKAYWRCSLGHNWRAKISSRTKRGCGCPICKGKIVECGKNDLKTLFPQIAKEWDYTLNSKGPEEYLPKSDYKAYWVCKYGHKWRMRIASRTQDGKGGCPECTGKKLVVGKNDLKSQYPEVAKEWDYDKNDKRPEDYFARSGYKAYWVCANGHEWRAQIASRTGPAKLGCRICSGKRPDVGKNDLKTLFPGISDEWDYEKNKDRPENHLPYSQFVAFWKCKNGHPSWRTSIAKRTQRGDGCPYCSGKRATPGINDLKTLYPNLIAEWDFELNKKDMGECAPFSMQKVYWKCEKGHSYVRRISDRTRADKQFGCPYCSGRMPIVGETDLETVDPDLCKEWSSKNTYSPSEFTVFSNKKVWWNCNVCGYEWMAMIGNRSKGWGCPNCSNRKRKKY